MDISKLTIDAIIFDFDGVIVDTEPIHFRAFQRILEPLELGFTWQDYVDVYMGFDDRDAFKAAFAAHNKQLTSDDLSSLIKRKAIIFQEVIADGVVPYPGVIDFVTHLRQIQKPLAICSGALRSDIMPILTMLGISDCFKIIITAEDVNISKPDPASYREAFERLKMLFPISSSPENTLAIEDTPAGIQSAKGVGLTVAAVTNSYDRQDLTSADIIVPSLISLRDAINTTP